MKYLAAQTTRPSPPSSITWAGRVLLAAQPAGHDRVAVVAVLRFLDAWRSWFIHDDGAHRSGQATHSISNTSRTKQRQGKTTREHDRGAPAGGHRDPARLLEADDGLRRPQLEELAGKVAGKLDLDLGQVTLKTFANGEVYCRYEESIRGADVFLVQSTCANEQTGMTPNDALVELLTMVDAAQGASAHRIIAVMPWYGYARQDKKSAPREPITARIVAKSLEAVGVDRVLTMDLHAGQVQGFFHIPVDHMTAMPMLTQWFIDQHLTDELVIVSPDAGRVKTARNFARRVGTHWAVMEKERPAQQVAEIGYVVGDVKGKTAVLVDDMIDTAGTLCAAAQTVLDEGAARVIACATHGVFSGPAYERLAYENSGIERIVVTDTLPLRPGAPDNIAVLSTASTFADSIRRIFTDDSVSEIFAGENQLF